MRDELKNLSLPARPLSSLVMSTPFFSIVIPTKGRAHLVGNAVESVLRQSFTDFEVLVIDNDDGDATRQTVNRFDDARFRYYRTGKLSMPDNFEFGAAQARGEYLLFVQDKQALHLRALKRLHELIERHQPPCLKWRSDSLDDLGNITWVEEVNGSGETRFLPSEEVLHTFINGRMSQVWDHLPIAHMSAYSRKLRDSILAGPLHRLCVPVSPDYVLGIQAMAFGDGVLFIDEGLVTGSRRHSNGHSLSRKTALGRQFMNEIGGAQKLWSRTPIQAPIIPPSLFNDYLELQAALGGRLAKLPINWVNYYVQTWCFVLGLDNDGVDETTDFAAFYAALEKETSEMQKRVWAAIEEREGRSAEMSLRKNRRKALRRRTGLLALERGWKMLNRRLSGRKHIGKFQNPLEFVIWADAHRRSNAGH
jgi:Glycosyl transferase family 2